MLFRSNIIDKNLLKFSNKITDPEKKEIISNMWSNYGMTFIEYIFLDNFRKKQWHINIEGEQILHEIFINNKPVIFITEYRDRGVGGLNVASGPRMKPF